MIIIVIQAVSRLCRFLYTRLGLPLTLVGTRGVAALSVFEPYFCCVVDHQEELCVVDHHGDEHQRLIFKFDALLYRIVFSASVNFSAGVLTLFVRGMSTVVALGPFKCLFFLHASS